METLTVAGVVPDGVAASQALLGVTEVVKGTFAFPETLTDRLCAPGSDPRFTILKVSGPPVTESVGWEVTTRLALITSGLLLAPAEVRVMMPGYVPAPRPVRAPAFTD